MEPKYFDSLYPADSRSAEIEKVLSYIKAGQSCQVIGVPGVGRSNLLRLLSFNHNVRVKHLGENQSNFHFLYLDFAEMKGKEINEVNKFIFLNLIRSFQERGFKEAYGEAERLFREALSLADPLVIFQNLKKTADILTNQQNLTLVFLFDRFEEYLPEASPEFFANLRLLRNLSKYRFSAIFALTQPLEDILPVSTFKEFYEFIMGHTVFLPLLDQPGIDFRLKHLEEVSGKNLDKEVKKAVLSLTGGHGKLTRVCAEAILEEGGNSNLEEFLLSQAKVRGACFEICLSFNPQEQGFLRKIAGGEQIEDTEAEKLFINLGLVQKNESLTLTIPLLAKFLSTHDVPEEKIYYRQGSNEILKGNQVISDDLTPAEFRLLKFFLQNPGRVLERDEIINHVWPEAKSTAGVSDEAIDQVIHRLRRKIETDPSNPQHLQTLKGRGFRFIP